MNDKELRKISRKELLEVLLEQAKKIESLEKELQKTKEELNSKKLVISESGNLAEASLKLSGIFEVAQQAADEYIYNIKENCKKIENATKKECKEYKTKALKEVDLKCQKMKQAADEYYNNAKEKVKELTKDKEKGKTVTKNKSSSNKKKTSTKSKKETTKEVITSNENSKNTNIVTENQETTKDKVVIEKSKKAIKGRPVRTIKKRKN